MRITEVADFGLEYVAIVDLLKKFFFGTSSLKVSDATITLASRSTDATRRLQ
jgi:hypothetical protein